MMQPCWKTGNFSKPLFPKIPLLCIHPGEIKASVYTQICTQMFTVALLVTATKWKQPTYLSSDEQINKTWYTSIQWNNAQQ